MTKLIRHLKSIGFRTLSGLITAGCFSMAAYSGETGPGVFHFNVSPNGYPPYLIVPDSAPAGIFCCAVDSCVPRHTSDVSSYVRRECMVHQWLVVRGYG